MKYRVVLLTAVLAAVAALQSEPGSAWPQMPNVGAAEQDLLVNVAAVRRTTVRRGAAGTTVRRTTVRRGAVGTTAVRRTAVVRAPYVHAATVRPWVRRSYYGTVIGGVALGTVAAATIVPHPPAANLCWVWTTPAHTAGYWDYCKPVR